MKVRILVLWDVTLCRRGDVSQLFEGTLGSVLEDELTTFLRKVREALAM